ncbi:MAG: hypothetical protein ACE5E6_11710 [Phycisphaerae bacterium]
MLDRKVQDSLATELEALLGKHFAGITVDVAPSARWNRPCATFRWSGFAGLLPEERFHRLVNVIPEPFRASRMKGLVWLELAPGETVDAYLKLPRSDEVAGREASIYAGLVQVDFFDALNAALDPSPQQRCPGDFSSTADVLARKGFASDRIRDAKLSFILHGAYCDCQVLLTVRHELATAYPSHTD